MKKAIIKNIKLPYPEFNWDMIDEETKLLERIEECRHLYGKPERWILANSESYEPTDVLQTEERTFSYTVQELNELGHTVEVAKERSETWVLLRAEYTIEIEDITEALKNEARINELKQLLAESDYRMTTDYYAAMSVADQTKWTSDRAAWRTELRNLLEGA